MRRITRDLIGIFVENGILPAQRLKKPDINLNEESFTRLAPLLWVLIRLGADE